MISQDQYRAAASFSDDVPPGFARQIMQQPGPFVGRRAELREISARAASAGAGQPQTVVIEGVPGIGKTSLLHRALQQLAEFWQLAADCSLGAAADQLMAVAGRTFPAGPGRRAGRARSGDNLAGGLLTAVRSLVADSRPLVLALDNVQCIDAESAVAVSAVLSALRTAPLLTIVASRDNWQPGPGEDPKVEMLRRQLLRGNGVTRLPLAELKVAEIARLLDGGGAAWPEQAVTHLHAYTGGHPALLSVLLDQIATVPYAAPGDLLGLSHPLVTTILDEVSRLPAPSRDLLAAIAVSEERWPLSTVGSVALVEDPFEALEPLLDLRLVKWFPAEAVAPVCISYPLYRDIIYRSLSAARRAALHNRASSFAIGSRALVHRAAATDVAATNAAMPPVATTLRQEAERYYLAGDSQRAGSLLLASTTATSDPAERQRHILQAAHWWLTLRAVDWGPKLDSCLSGWPQSAPRSLIQGLLEESAGRYTRARALLAEAEELMSADTCSPLLKADIGLAQALVHADLGDTQAQARIANDLLAIDDMPAEHRAWAEYHAAAAAARLNGGPLAALAKLSALLPGAVLDGSNETGGVPPGSQSVRLWARGSWRVLSGHLHDGVDDLARMLRAGDRAAADPVRPWAHAYMAYAYHLLGEPKQAEQAAGQAVTALEGHAVARLRVPVHAIAACVDAAAGRSDAAAAHLEAAKRWCAECGPEDYVAFCAIAAATVAQASENYPRMLSALQPLTCRPGVGEAHQAWWLPLQVEALIGTGQIGAAAQALSRLAAFAGASGRYGGTVAWLDARLAAARHDNGAARMRFEDALARPPVLDDVPLHGARLEHDYGRLLMSARNRRAAIGRLRRAYELYRALGARPFAERCAADLEACGAHECWIAAAHAGHGASPVLSSRERKIAYLAAQGLTNQEIAAEIFVSAKTVEYHLGNVFAKLGITSRRQLPAQLAEDPAA